MQAPNCRTSLALMILALTGCQGGYTMPEVARFQEPDLIVSHSEGPANAPPGSCWGKDDTPAIIETVTEQVIVQPPELENDGTVRVPPIFHTETRQKIVRPRREIWFEAPCPDVLTPDFVTSVQRALFARGLYRGPLTGTMDPRTRAAIRRFQSPQGLESGILSLAAARQLGLISIERDMAGEDTPPDPSPL